MADDSESRLLLRMEATLTRFEKQMRDGVRLARKGAQDVDKELSKTGRGFDARVLGQSFSQMSQQITAGGSVVQSFSVQLADMTMGFGPAGMAIGALAGVALPMLVNAFSDSEEEAVDLQDALDDLQGKVKALATANANLEAGSLDGLVEQYGTVNEEILKMIENQRTFALEAAQLSARTAAQSVRQQFGSAEAMAERLGVPYTVRQEAERSQTGEVFRTINPEVQRYFDLLTRIEQSGSLEQQADAAAELQEMLAAAGLGGTELAAEVNRVESTLRQLLNETRDVPDALDDGTVSASELKGELSGAADEAERIGTALGNAERRMGAINRTGSFRGDQLGAEGLGASFNLIRQIENPRGFWQTPEMDSKANGGGPDQLRIGWSSDTITRLVDGIERVQRGINPGDRVTEEDADRDLRRRIRLIHEEVISKVGADVWNALPPAVQAAITSVGYNYGTVGPGGANITGAIETGNLEAIASAIENLSANPERRAEEAALVRDAIRNPATAIPPTVGGDVAAAEQEAAEDFAADRLRAIERGEAEAQREADKIIREAQQAIERADREAASDAERAAKEAEDARQREIDQRTDLTDRARQSARDAEFEATLVGKTADEVTRLRTRYLLLNQAREAGVDLNERVAGTEETYGDMIERTSRLAGAAVARQEALTDATDRAADRQDFLNQQWEDFQSGLVGAIVAGEGFDNVLKNLATSLAEATLQAALFGTGPFGGQSGSGLFGGLAGLFGATPQSHAGGGWTGWGSRTGGIDGQGGFLGILHPREQVIDTTRGQQAGGSVGVRVWVEDDGTLRGAIQREGGRSAQRAISAYDRGMPGRVKAIQQDSRRR